MFPAPTANLDDPALYINRDLSWLEFNRRVLEEAQDPTVPMLERLKFLAIVSSNLDEFFMVRVGNTQQKVQSRIPIGSGADQTSPRGATREDAAVRAKPGRGAVPLSHGGGAADACRNTASSSAAANDLTEDERRQVRELFRREIFPVLTPLATDPAHPFPHLLNKSLNLAVVAQAARRRRPALRRRAGAERHAAVRGAARNGQQPRGHPRIARPRPGSHGAQDRTPSAPRLDAFVPLEDVIRLHLGDLFPGMELGRAVAFRVTRDSEYELDDEVDDLLEEIEAHVQGAPPRPPGAAGDRGRCAGRHRAVPRRRAEARDRRCLPDPRAARPDRAVPGLRRARLRRPARSAVRPRAGRRVRAVASAVAGHSRPRHPGLPPLRVVRPGGGLHRGRGGGRARARHQADALPHDQRLAHRARAPARGRSRQAGDGGDRAEGPHGRGAEHHLGEGTGEVRRPRRLRLRRA